MSKKLVLPKRYIRLEDSSTVARMHRKSGKLDGRVKARIGDGTRVRRVIKDVDVDKDGKVDFHGGTIYGRTRSIKVKSSKRARGYVRKI